MSAPAPGMFSPFAQQVIQQQGYEVGKPNLVTFSETLLDLARENRNVLAVTSDSRGSGKIGPLGAELPEQIVEVSKLACDVAKATNPNVHRLINNCCPFAEITLLRKKMIKTICFIVLKTICSN